jgi:Fur family transcriptional regulator, ferric uptake regulator
MSEHPWLVQLNEQGYRLTEARRAVVEIMAQSTHALTPIEIFDEARETHPALGLVTVYRTLEALEKQGLIQRVHQPQGCQAFIHCTCWPSASATLQQCGEAALFEGDDLETLIKSIARRTGYQITEHWLQLFGLCPNCRKDKHETHTDFYCFLCILFSACGGQPASGPGTDGPVILTSTPFLADITRAVAGDRVQVESLLPLADPHSYQPTPRMPPGFPRAG